MPWQECDAVSNREEFCRLAVVSDSRVSVLCRRFGISRKTGYKWLQRFRGGEPCSDRSRRPRRFAPTSAAVEAEVLELRDRHPAWGGRKLRGRVSWPWGGDRSRPPARSRRFCIGGYGLSRRSRRSVARGSDSSGRHPRVRWQMDFKGDFKTADGRRCHALTITDDHSRYSLGLRACLNQKSETVRESLCGVFQRYGLPGRC